LNLVCSDHFSLVFAPDLGSSIFLVSFAAQFSSCHSVSFGSGRRRRWFLRLIHSGLRSGPSGVGLNFCVENFAAGLRISFLAAISFYADFVLVPPVEACYPSSFLQPKSTLWISCFCLDSWQRLSIFVVRVLRWFHFRVLLPLGNFGAAHSVFHAGVAWGPVCVLPLARSFFSLAVPGFGFWCSSHSRPSRSRFVLAGFHVQDAGP
jgi:hypothetical protein